MTVVEKARSTAPRSALRYRPITTGLESPSQPVTRTRKSRADAHMTTAPAAPDDLAYEQHPVSRSPRSAPLQRTHVKRYVPPWIFMSTGILVTLLLWVGVTHLLAWGSSEYNAIVYGSPRTFQIDALVDQGDSPQHPSHFESLNLHGVVTILEFPAGDASHVRVLATYPVPGPDADQTVAMIRFFDVNHNGRPDLIIDIEGIESILVNDGASFRPPTLSEQQSILQALQHAH